MRIIGGNAGGRVLHVPQGLPVRPTTDKAKEALFNHLNHHFNIEGLTVLDLFSGTGSMALEFASRGAIVEVWEIHPKCLAFISESAKTLRLEVNTKKSDVFKSVATRSTKGYDLIFADPPYSDVRLRDLPDHILKNGFLSEDGTFILEHPSMFSFQSHSNFLEARKYGQSMFSFFTNESHA
jgi:16S rRNA (guanine(966)-N(2))-methyltransferase RsmD